MTASGGHGIGIDSPNIAKEQHTSTMRMLHQVMQFDCFPLTVGDMRLFMGVFAILRVMRMITAYIFPINAKIQSNPSTSMLHLVHASHNRRYARVVMEVSSICYANDYIVKL